MAQVKNALEGCPENLTIVCVIFTVEKYLFPFHNWFTNKLVEFQHVCKSEDYVQNLRTDVWILASQKNHRC